MPLVWMFLRINCYKTCFGNKNRLKRSLDDITIFFVKLPGNPKAVLLYIMFILLRTLPRMLVTSSNSVWSRVHTSSKEFYFQSFYLVH